MTIYLPIAEISVNLFLLLGLGVGVGMLSGIFGVGGGFLMTPLLIFLGVPPPVAVGTEANQILASSLSGAMGHWRRGNVDVKMGTLLLAGGVVGSAVGIWFFSFLRTTGNIDVFINLCYVIILSLVGGLMLSESIKTIRRSRAGTSAVTRIRVPKWIKAFPFKIRFRRSKLYTSLVPPLILGLFVGMLAAIMGVGGGFLMIPAMIYLLGMPATLVVGTSLFQIVFVTAMTTFLQATVNQTVDLVLAAILLLGGVIGAQLGVKWAYKVRGEYFRLMLAGMILIIAFILFLGLVITPSSLFSLDTIKENL